MFVYLFKTEKNPTQQDKNKNIAFDLQKDTIICIKTDIFN